MTLISEDEALQHCHVARDGTSLSFGSDPDHAIIMWLTAKSVGLPTPLNQNPMPNNCHTESEKGQRDSEALLQVGREHGIKNQRGHSFIIYKQKLLALMRKPMPAYEKLAILLPCRMGFRAAEVGTWRAEYIDFVNEECQVMDCKKHQLFKVLLDRRVARLAEEVLHGRDRGYVLSGRSRKKEYEGKPIGPITVWCIWKKHTDLSPLDGRRGFAALWYYGIKGSGEHKTKSISTLQHQMRHASPGQTLDYVSRMVFWEDMQREFNEFQNELDLELDGFPLGDIEVEAQT